MQDSHYFFFLPKIHKNGQLPQGRPIVNAIELVTAHLGQYIDFFLKPLVADTKATKHIIQILESLTCSSNSILTTADVSSLYTIIGYQDALASLKWTLRGSDMSRTHSKYLLKCLNFCLNKNYFWYDRQFYL